MSFDPRIAVKRDPAEANLSPPAQASRTGETFVSLVVNGELSEGGQAEMAGIVRQSFEEGADTVTIDMQNVVLKDAACLEHFAASLMAERSAGRQVQVVAREPVFHAACASIVGSRDWLIDETKGDVSGGRHALHVDSGHSPA